MALSDTVVIQVLKSVCGVLAGGLVAAVGYWIAAVVALLVMTGLPLGSRGGPPTTADVLVHLALAGAASFSGALVAVRIATYRPYLHALITGALVAMAMILGFSKPASDWPAWFPYGMGAACAGGTVLASQIAVSRFLSR